MVVNPAYRLTTGKLPTGSQCRGLITYVRQPHATTDDRCVVGHLTISMLPDELLLGIFDFCVCEADDKQRWVTLVHVCRRWRSVVFASPNRLDLRLVCTHNTHARDMLCIWPALPIVVRRSYWYSLADNVVAALEHKDRVCEIYMNGVSVDEFDDLARVMENPFTALTHLHLDAYRETPNVPDSFLGGSAPLLRSLYLMNFTYPALPKLLLSATGLVSLTLSDGFCISPQTMAACLTSLTRLEKLQIEFRLEWLHEGHRQPSEYPPLIWHTDLRPLPVLTTPTFVGARQYFDDLFTHIDAPRLEDVKIHFANPPAFDCSQIFPFSSLKESFEALDQAHMGREDYVFVNVTLSSRRGTTGGKMPKLLILRVIHDSPRWRLRKLNQDCCRPSSLSPAKFERFDVREVERRMRNFTVGNDRWLELFHFFPAVENLYLSEGLAICVAPALRGLVGEGVAEVLPALQNLFIRNYPSSGSIKEAIGEFVAARELSGHPVTVQSWAEEISEEACRELPLVEEFRGYYRRVGAR